MSLEHTENRSQLKRRLLLGTVVAAGGLSIVGALKTAQRPVIHADTLTAQDSQVHKNNIQTSFNNTGSVNHTNDTQQSSAAMSQSDNNSVNTSSKFAQVPLSTAPTQLSNDYSRGTVDTSPTSQQPLNSTAKQNHANLSNNSTSNHVLGAVHYAVKQGQRRLGALPNHGIWNRDLQKVIFIDGQVGDKNATQVAVGELGWDRNAYFDYAYVIGQGEEAVFPTAEGNNGNLPIWSEYHPQKGMVHYWYLHEPTSNGITVPPFKVHSQQPWYFWVGKGQLTKQNMGTKVSNQGNTTNNTPNTPNTPTNNTTDNNTTGNNTGQQGSGGNNGSNGGGNGTQANGNGTNGGGNGSPANNPNNSNNPNNGQPNNSNPNNDDPNNVIVPGHDGGHTSNNNNITPNGPVINNNDNDDGNWYNWHTDDSLVSALANDENRDNQDALNRMNSDYQVQAARAASMESSNAATSAAIASVAAKNANKAQATSIANSAEIQSLSNEIVYNNKKSALAASATSAKESYMASLDNNHGYVNSVAQDALDDINGDTDLGSSERQSALAEIQAQANNFLDIADHKSDATSTKSDLLSHINDIKSQMNRDNSSNQTSNVDRATDSVNTAANSLTDFVNTFSGLSQDQRNNASNEAQQYLNEASEGININKDNNVALQSIADAFNTNADELEFNIHAESTFDSTAVQNSKSAAISSADSVLQQNASNAATSIMDNSGLTQAQQDQMNREVQTSLSNATNSANATINAGNSVTIKPSLITSPSDNNDFNVSTPSDAQANAENHADQSYVEPDYNTFDNAWASFMNNLNNTMNNQTSAEDAATSDGYLPYYNYYDYNNSYNPYYSDINGLNNNPDYYNNYYNDWDNYADEVSAANDYAPDDIYNVSWNNTSWPDYLNDDYTDYDLY